MCALAVFLSAAAALAPPARADNALSYLAHVGLGQLRLIRERQELTPEKIATLSPREQEQLETLRRALRYGESQGLVHSTSYRELSDNGKPWLVQVVTAAPANRMEPLTWWFPIVGSVSYRGYFDAERARAFAAELAGEGYDVYLRPSPLYSTLGWFDDPLPRPLLSWPVEDLVDTVIHEQVHATVYVASDVAYDENLATFVAHHATLAFLADQPEAAERARAAFADELTFAQLLNALRGELDALYAAGPSPEQARSERAPIFARYQTEVYAAQSWRGERFAGFKKLALSNAWLVGNRDYVGLAPCFERELASLDGDLPAFVRAHREHPGHRPEGCAEPEPH
ncbi:MAG TPA: aminopeptidase [Myxococcota bacterium]|nr:aminopeptidase [Myxococcota bacterium]